MSIGTPANNQKQKKEGAPKAEQFVIATELKAITGYHWEPVPDGKGYLCTEHVSISEVRKLATNFGGIFFKALETKPTRPGGDLMFMYIQHHVAKKCLEEYKKNAPEHSAATEDTPAAEVTTVVHMTQGQSNIVTGLNKRTSTPREPREWIVQQNGEGETEYRYLASNQDEANKLLAMYDGFFNEYVSVSAPLKRGNIVLTIDASQAKNCLDRLNAKQLPHQGKIEALHASRLAERDAATPATAPSQARG